MGPLIVAMLGIYVGDPLSESLGAMYYTMDGA